MVLVDSLIFQPWCEFAGEHAAKDQYKATPFITFYYILS